MPLTKEERKKRAEERQKQRIAECRQFPGVYLFDRFTNTQASMMLNHGEHYLKFELSREKDNFSIVFTLEDCIKLIEALQARANYAITRLNAKIEHLNVHQINSMQTQAEIHASAPPEQAQPLASGTTPHP